MQGLPAEGTNARATDGVFMMPPRPMEVPQDQGYYEHALLEPDRPEEGGTIARRVRPLWQLFWLAAGVLVGALLIGFFVWIALGFR